MADRQVKCRGPSLHLERPARRFAFGGKKRPKDTPRRFYLGTHEYMLQQCRFLCTMGGSQG